MSNDQKNLRSASASDIKCKNCRKKFSAKCNDAICCESCAEWWHGACAGIDPNDLPVLAKYTNVHWHCSQFESLSSAKDPRMLLNLMEETKNSQTEAANERKTQTDMVSEIKQHLLELNPVVAELGRKDLSFSEALKTNLSFSDKPKTTEGVDVPKKDPNKILIASSTNRFRDSIEIKKEFARLFPLKRLVFAFNTARGNIHLEFLTVEEADEVFNNWQPHFLGQNSVIRKASTQEKINKAEIIRHVPTDKTETQIETDLAFNFNVKASRFVKKDGTVLGTVKLIFETSQDQEKVTTDGIFLDNIFYRAQPFVQQGIKNVRCFKCQKFGHISANCKSETSCGYFSGRHTFKECPNKDENPQCANCKSNHSTDSLQCTIYLKQAIAVDNSRGMPLPLALKKQIADNHDQ